MATVTLGACLIVKDEERLLPACLESLRGVVDEVCVYDTGSRDATVEIARAHGARVEQGTWDHDFGRARNAALAMSRATWVLAVDADERLVADRRALLAYLRAHADDELLLVRIANLDAEGAVTDEHAATRLLRRGTVRWQGRLHEQPVRLDGRLPRGRELPRELLRLDHLGYAAGPDDEAKQRRNVEISRRGLADVLEGGSASVPEQARALLNLARSLLGAGSLQEAADAFELVRDLAPGTEFATMATVSLVDLCLAARTPEPVLALAAELETSGAAPGFVAWTRARGLLALGRDAAALAQLRAADPVVDPLRRETSAGQVLETRAGVAARCGLPEEAARCLVGAMAARGRVAGRGLRLLATWDGLPVAALAELLEQDLPAALRPELAAEVAVHGPAGAWLADVLRRPVAADPDAARPAPARAHATTRS